MSINPETAVSYAALILADEGVEITTDKLQALLKAADVEIEPIWSTIFAKALKDKDIKEVLTSIRTSGPPAVNSGSSGDGGDNGKAPDPDPALNTDAVYDEEGSESGSDIVFGLFD